MAGEGGNPVVSGQLLGIVIWSTGQYLFSLFWASVAPGLYAWTMSLVAFIPMVLPICLIGCLCVLGSSITCVSASPCGLRVLVGVRKLAFSCVCFCQQVWRAVASPSEF